MVLVDTGIRASELSGLNLRNIDIKAGHLTVMGKGDKERQIYFSARTGQALWRYLRTRTDTRPDDPVFLSSGRRRLNRNDLAQTLNNAGKRAGIHNSVHPHRFRHTFAIQYLRNGGDVYTLQRILGHSTLEMCRRYLKLASVDLEGAHRRASPAENWRL
jgi:integrase/recombinase XerD